MSWFKRKPPDCQVHVFDIFAKDSVQIWIIDKHISRKQYDALKDENGHLYALSLYKDGKAGTYAIPELEWKKHRQASLSAPKPSSLEDHFNHCLNLVTSSSNDAQLISAVTISTLWRAFNATYPDINQFKGADESEQLEYFRKFSDVVQQLVSQELLGQEPEGGSRGAALVQIYLVAVAKNDVTLINRFAAALEPFNKLAFEKLNSGQL